MVEGRSMDEKKKKKKKKGTSESKRKMGSLSEVLERENCRRVEAPTVGELEKDGKKRGKSGVLEELEGKRSKNSLNKQERNDITEESNEELTLAEIKMKASSRKMIRNKQNGKKKVQIREEGAVTEEKEKRRRMLINNRDVEVMTVEDSDFYDFDEDRVERSFKKDQVWAIYDDDDGMPRHYGVIDEVVSLNPFEVRMIWLDFQHDGDERLTSWEQMGFHISCGRFVVARKDTTNLLNIFSHMVECERTARRLYRIYPKKGSIWALYNEKALDVEGRDSLFKDKRCCDIVVFLTSYSQMYGLSMA